MKIIPACIIVTVFACMAAPSVQALPPVVVSTQCEWTTAFDAPLRQILNFLLENDAPLPEGFDYRYADMELGTGDGLPDHFQLMLFASALCTNNEGLMDQFESNQTKIDNYLVLLDQFVQWLDGFRLHAATAADEVRLFTQWPMYSLFVPESTRAQVDEVLQLLDSVSQYNQEWPELSAQLEQIREQLAGVSDLVAATAGLSSEMLQTFKNAVNENLMAQLAPYQEQLATLTARLQVAASMAGDLEGFYDRGAELQSALSAIVTDIQTLQTIVAALPFPDLAIYGVEKAGGEPFSASGDYDHDGRSNLEAYQILGGYATTDGAPVQPAAFVKAASGANPWYYVDPASLPAAGVVGLGIVAAVIAVAGAFIMLKR